MINTTELRRLRDAATKGPWTDDSDSYETYIFGADTCMILEMRGFGSEESGGRPQGEHVHSQKFITWAANHAHAIADELDALREWKAVEQQHLISSATALLFAGWRSDGSVTEAVKWACGELDALRKRALEAELLLACVTCDGNLTKDTKVAIDAHLAKYQVKEPA